MILRTIVEDDKTLVLRKNKALELLLGNVVLLSSAALETERDFGRLAKDAKRVVIGGLGFGSTLRGVLDVAPADAEVIVVEKLKTVIDIARNEAKDLLAGALEDPRVRIEQADVFDVLSKESNLDAILLDVDNAPEWASFRTNARLYAEGSLSTLRAKIAPGGMLAVWAGYEVPKFVQVLRRAGFTPKTIPLHERGVVRARAYVAFPVLGQDVT